MRKVIKSTMPRLGVLTPRSYVWKMFRMRTMIALAISYASLFVIYCVVSARLGNDRRADLGRLLLQLAAAGTGVALVGGYPVDACLFWFGNVTVMISSDEVILRILGIRSPLRFRVSSPNPIYVDRRDPYQPKLIFPLALVPPPLPIHPKVEVSAIEALFSQSQFLVVKPYIRAAGRRVPVAAIDHGRPIVPRYITFAFPEAITDEVRVEIAAVVDSVPRQMVLSRHLEYPDRHAVRVAINPDLLLDAERSYARLIGPVLDRLEERGELVRRLSCVLLEESAEFPPPLLFRVRRTSWFGRLTIALYRPWKQDCTFPLYGPG
jgi:hypothetical protein